VPTICLVNPEGLIVGAGYGPLDIAGPEFIQFLETLRSAS
jgi:hypothetical protein